MQARVGKQAPKLWCLFGNTSLIGIKPSNTQASRIADKTVLCCDIHGFRKRHHRKLTFYTITGQPVAENTNLVTQNSWWTWSQRTTQMSVPSPVKWIGNGSPRSSVAGRKSSPFISNHQSRLDNRKIAPSVDQHTDLQMQELCRHVKQKRSVFHLGPDLRTS